MSSLMIFVLGALAILAPRDLIQDHDVGLEIRVIHWGCWLMLIAAVFPAYALFLLIVTGVLFMVVGFEVFPKMFKLGFAFITAAFVYKVLLT